MEFQADRGFGMDVSRIGRSGPTQIGKAPRNAGQTEGFSQMVGGRPATTGSIGSAASLGALESLLAVQEAESALDRRARARRRAGDLLDGLDRIREGLLTGGLAPERLDALAALAAEHRGEVDDPALSELLDEIELRVHVELAKLGRDPPRSA
jgi:hypothetical protein